MPAPGAAEFVPAHADLPALRAAAAKCRGCDLYRDTTRTVFGEGNERARIVLIGEQPGDREDREGHPFVGPAGRLLDRALAEVGLDRDMLYLTNAVKHFKFTERGKRRIHQQPTRTEVVACSAWLTAELDLVAPELVVCLGAVAAKAILDPSVKVTEIRGQVVPPPRQTPENPDGSAPTADYRVLVTVHPSSVLRAPDRDAAYRAFVADMAHIRPHVESDRSDG
ncbi:UdgX family uracil-DNA binding protein [Nocardia paucivorans]|uniref:UdgX family uracil-DNA binding protein n=1 Tax=Nocardia paucivorans TaxID=114259 RepID=UPI0002DBF571|nr:UdgX family uracil-DNA binding protein [Nocardia paucivorans]